MKPFFSMTFFLFCLSSVVYAAKPIPITNDMILKSYLLPPSPRKLGRQTILGIDSNKNGIRDDIERIIYNKSENPVERALMLQLARDYERIMRDPIGYAKKQKNAKDSSKSQDFKDSACERYIEDLLSIDFEKKYGKFLTIYLQDKYMNTKERRRLYRRYNVALSGGVYSVPLFRDQKIEACEFDVVSLVREAYDKHTKIQKQIVIDGHELPLNPSRGYNNLTLLGVDVNHNGIRDDIEHYIFERYKEFDSYKKLRAVALQYAYALQVILVDKEKAYGLLHDASQCRTYVINQISADNWKSWSHNNKKFPILDREFIDNQFNTYLRSQEYWKYTQLVKDRKMKEERTSKNSCNINIELL